MDKLFLPFKAIEKALNWATYIILFSVETHVFQTNKNKECDAKYAFYFFDGKMNLLFTSVLSWLSTLNFYFCAQ